MAATHPETYEAIAGIPTIDPRWDNRFRDLTCLGNAAFDAGEDARADVHYRAALEEAEHLFDIACREGSAILVAPMALTIAVNNLATTLKRAGRAEAARTLSIEVAERLIATAEAVDRPIALRLNCLRHLRHALTFAAAFDHGRAQPVAAQIAQRAVAAATEVTRVADLWRRTEGKAGSECALPAKSAS